MDLGQVLAKLSFVIVSQYTTPSSFDSQIRRLRHIYYLRILHAMPYILEARGEVAFEHASSETEQYSNFTRGSMLKSMESALSALLDNILNLKDMSAFELHITVSQLRGG